jgi:reverse gyrase
MICLALLRNRSFEVDDVVFRRFLARAMIPHLSLQQRQSKNDDY